MRNGNADAAGQDAAASRQPNQQQLLQLIAAAYELARLKKLARHRAARGSAPISDRAFRSWERREAKAEAFDLVRMAAAETRGDAASRPEWVDACTRMLVSMARIERAGRHSGRRRTTMLGAEFHKRLRRAEAGRPAHRPPALAPLEAGLLVASVYGAKARIVAAENGVARGDLVGLRNKLRHEAKLDATTIEALLDKKVSDRKALLVLDPSAGERLGALCRRLQRARKAHPFRLPSN